MQDRGDSRENSDGTFQLRTPHLVLLVRDLSESALNFALEYQ